MRDYPPQPAGAARTEIMYKPPAVMAWLATVSGPRAGKLHRLSPDVTTIGRDSHNDIIIDDVKVSRQHAKVKCEELPDDQHQFSIFDLATSNGTLVNGAEILKEALYDGDRIQLGETALVFKQIDGPQRPSREAEEEGEEESKQEGE
jgi:pSer/pThr/pTyr-binding forkhead associated (FHA) protein